MSCFKVELASTIRLFIEVGFGQVKYDSARSIDKREVNLHLDTGGIITAVARGRVLVRFVPLVLVDIYRVY